MVSSGAAAGAVVVLVAAVGLGYVVLRKAGGTPPPPVNPQVTLLEVIIPQGYPLGYVGTGFTPGGKVQLSIPTAGLVVSPDVEAGSDGRVSGTVGITTGVPPGQQTFTAIDVTSGLGSSESFLVEFVPP